MILEATYKIPDNPFFDFQENAVTLLYRNRIKRRNINKVNKISSILIDSLVELLEEINGSDLEISDNEIDEFTITYELMLNSIDSYNVAIKKTLRRLSNDDPLNNEYQKVLCNTKEISNVSNKVLNVFYRIKDNNLSNKLIDISFNSIGNVWEEDATDWGNFYNNSLK